MHFRNPDQPAQSFDEAKLHELAQSIRFQGVLVPLIVRDLFKILGKINREDKVTILVVEQNAQLALELADQAYVIETGKIVMSGNAKDIATNEDVRKSYLGY